MDYYNGTQHEANRSGFSFSFDQDVTEHLGLFARYGASNTQAFTPMSSFMVGVDYKSPLPGRKDDDAAITFIRALAAGTFRMRRRMRGISKRTTTPSLPGG